MSDKINTKYGPGTLVRLGEQVLGHRISTGIFDLDLALGGGWRGPFDEVWGGRSTGKSTIAAHTVHEAQQICRYDGLLLGDPKVEGNSPLPLVPTWTDPKGGTHSGAETETDEFKKAAYEKKTVKLKDEEGKETGETQEIFVLRKGWVQHRVQEPLRCTLANVEQAVDPDWYIHCGADKDLTNLLNVTTTEHVVDLIEVLLRDQTADFVVLDSIASMSPLWEQENTAEKKAPPKNAELLNRALRSWLAAIVERRGQTVLPRILLVNQVRSKINLPYANTNPDVKTAGLGQDFASVSEVKLEPGKREKADFLSPEDGGLAILNRTNFKVTKNKTYPPLGYGQFITCLIGHDGYSQGEIMQLRSVFETARRYNVIQNVKDKWLLGGLEFRTQKAVAEHLREHPTDFRALWRALVPLVTAARIGRKVGA